MNLLAKAIKIAASAHAKQIDKSGAPYILHPLWIMHKVQHLEELYMITAILHDVIEDTSWTIKGLEMEGFPKEVLVALELLDMRGKDYHEAINKMVISDLAIEVKMRDLEHNSKITRLKGLTQKDHDRLAKYNKAYNFLKEYR